LQIYEKKHNLPNYECFNQTFIHLPDESGLNVKQFFRFVLLFAHFALSLYANERHFTDTTGDLAL